MSQAMLEFQPDHVFWPEVSSLVIGTFMFWEHHRHWGRLTVEPVRFLGQHCECLRLHQVSQIMGVTQGLRDLESCRFQPIQKPSPNHMPPLPSQDNQFIRHLQQIAIGSAFEKCMPSIRARWGAGRKNHKLWPTALLLAYHIRNGCFHGNTFTFQEPTFPVPWNGLVLVRADQGSQVMGLGNGKLGLADVIALLHEMAQKID